jgi:hypothetical protein
MLNTKRIFTIGIGILLLTLGVVPTYAEDAVGSSGQNKAVVRQEIKTQIQEVKDERKIIQSTTPKESIQQKEMNLLQRFMSIRAVVTGVITAKTDTSITVKNTDNVSYIVHIVNTTVLRRKFWGKAALTEMQIGDSVNVIGKWTNDAKTDLNAQMIRDTSIQKRAGAFFGNVLSVTANGWTIQTARGIETVSITSSTKLVNRKEETIKQSDIVIGQRIRVKGMWDSQANTITEVTQIKDFTLPIIVTPTKTP